MPTSLNVLDSHLGTIIDVLRPATVCDIGPGAGKCGQIVRSMGQQKGFSVTLTGVEIDPAYVERFKLRSLYDEVIIEDVMLLIGRMDIKFDLVIIGDMIEHLRKSDGVDLLNFLLYRVSHICVIYPTALIQEGSHGHPQEAHISSWSREDFRGWEALHASRGFMNITLIKGYRPGTALGHRRLKKLFANTVKDKAVRSAKQLVKSIIVFFYPTFRRKRP